MNDQLSTQDKIMKAMFELVAENGYAETSVAKICEKVGVKKPTLYYYFSSKEALFEKMYEDILLKQEPPYDIKALYAIEDLDAYKAFIENSFIDYIDLCENDLTMRRVQMEFYVQSNRIPRIAKMKDKIYDALKKEIKEVLSYGYTKGFLKDETAIDKLTDILYTFSNGIDFNMTFGLSLNNKANWHYFIQHFFNSYC